MKIESDVVIVGAGPAGLAAALALSTYGVKVTLLTKRRGLANTPRAHVTNQRTFEVFRDLGIEQQAKALATSYVKAPDVVYCSTLAGEEYARWQAFGTGPGRIGDYLKASPCEHADLAQNILEPLLLNTTLARGAQVRFSTEYVSHAQDDHEVRTVAIDHLTGSTIELASKFLIGADGAKSVVAAQLDLPMEGAGQIGHSMNIYFEADLTRFTAYRPAFLYLLLNKPAGPGDLGLSVLRPTRHWTEWLLTSAYVFAPGEAGATADEAIRIVRDRVGDPHLELRIKTIDPWEINSLCATRYSRGRVFCVGDAVHRHPPSNGLGSNMAVQDAYNLAWKLAFVLQGKADASLLDTYGQERAPVGKRVVERSTKSLGANAAVLQALGLVPGETEGSEAGTSGPDGDERQARLHDAVSQSRYNFNAHGVEMNQLYRSSAVIDDTVADRDPRLDDDLVSVPSTRPGSHLPHAWVQVRGCRASTLDLVGKGRFALLTGIGGEVWIEAAEHAGRRFDIVIEPRMIAPRAGVTDLYGEWRAVRDIEGSGCLLVRPDGTIAMRQWRSVPAAQATEALAQALRTILGRPEKAGA